MRRPSLQKIKSNRELFTFLEEYLGDELEPFLRWVQEGVRDSIRVNTLKTTRQALKERLLRQGFEVEDLEFPSWAMRVLKAPLELGNTIEHFLGHFYVQDVASMLPPIALGPQPGETVLDIAAAPGSKTTQMAQMMENTGVIVANDLNFERIKALTTNIDRLGVLNTVVTETDGGKIAELMPGRFDRALVDAPCSALGTLYRSPELAKWWSWNKVFRLVGSQRKLILAGYDSLRPGGVMVYSTCTLVPIENEGIVAYLLENRPEARVTPIEGLAVRTRPGLRQWKSHAFPEEVELTLRVLPFESGTEGFYLARIEKPTT